MLGLELLIFPHAVKAQDVSNNVRDLPNYKPGRTIYMYGRAPSSGIFNIDLVPEYDDKYSDEVIALRLGVDVATYHVSRNSFIHGKWLYEENDGYSGIQPRRFFNIIIIVQNYGYEISIGGYHFTTYYHRIPITKNMRISVSEEVYMEPIELY